MSIKHEADDAFFWRHTEQRALANALGEAFDITYGAQRGELFVWLAQPSTRTKERFGLQKEVLVVYSPFPKTDARVLTTLENVARSPDFRHRIDRVLALVIHAGDIQDAEALVASVPERVIVAFHERELTDTKRSAFFVRNRISEALGSVDLFGMSSPLVSDRYFFGRNELVQQLSRRASVQRQNSGLFGLRKTGKTSVLYALSRSFEDQPVLWEYFDCQNPGIHNARWWDVLSNIRDRLGSALTRTHKRTAKLSREYTESTAGTRFVADLIEILQVGALEHVVIALDEIEYITSGLAGTLGAHWDKDFLPFWQSIRAAHQELQGRFTFIVAGVNPACVQQSHFGESPNPIFQAAQPHFLAPLSEDAIRQMVRTLGRYSGFSFTEQAIDWLRERYGGHPFLIRLACSEVWHFERRMEIEGVHEVGATSFLSRNDLIQRRLAQPIKDILLSLVWWYPDEYDLLRILADGDASFVDAFLQNQSASMLQFAQYGLLKPGSSDFAIADVRDFLRSEGENYQREVSPFKRSDMPPELLPEVPDLAALARLFEKRCQLEIRLRRAIVTYLGVRFSFSQQEMAKAIVRGLRKRPDRPKPESLFIGRELRDVMHDLYTLDLKEVVVANWDVFKPLFQQNQSRFEMNMDTINKARRVEGHTKPVSSEEQAEFENSYSWLLGRLQDLDATLGIS